MKFAANGTLYRGSKPVMWSVVEKTALAEAEVEYEDYVSDQVWVKFPVAPQFFGQENKKSWIGSLTVQSVEEIADPYGLLGSNIVIWTTTPWTLPGNRAISYSPKISYGLFEVMD